MLAAPSPGEPADAPLNDQTPADEQAPRPLPRPMVGFTLNLYYTDDLTPHLRAVEQLAAMGVNTLQVATPAFQKDGAACDISVNAAPGRSPTRQHLVTLLSYARDRGLATVLMPQVLFTDPRGNEWRGKIQPESWQAWWRRYIIILDYFTGIAADTDASVLVLGSELLSTEKHQHRWRRLIARARQRYRGQLCYSTNWDHYHVPRTWKDLDMVGVNGYWDITTLTDPDHPDPAKLAERWREIRERLYAFSKDVGKPLLLTEVGYPCLPWGLKHPWNYVNPRKLGARPGVQRLGYEAFLAAWGDDLKPAAEPASPPPPLAGVLFYEWDLNHHGGPTDTGYGVRGKPTEKLLGAWLKQRAANQPAD